MLNMRITNEDIDALIDVASILRNLADIQRTPDDELKFRTQCHHVRKVYILLIKASSREIIDLHQLIFEGIVDDPQLDKAITALCPNV